MTSRDSVPSPPTITVGSGHEFLSRGRSGPRQCFLPPALLPAHQAVFRPRSSSSAQRVSGSPRSGMPRWPECQSSGPGFVQMRFMTLPWCGEIALSGDQRDTAQRHQNPLVCTRNTFAPKSSLPPAPRTCCLKARSGRTCVTQRRATGARKHEDQARRSPDRGRQHESQSGQSHRTPAVELRCGGLHLTVQRVPVWLISLITTAAGARAAWWTSR